MELLAPFTAPPTVFDTFCATFGSSSDALFTVGPTLFETVVERSPAIFATPTIPSEAFSCTVVADSLTSFHIAPGMDLMYVTIQ